MTAPASDQTGATELATVREQLRVLCRDAVGIIDATPGTGKSTAAVRGGAGAASRAPSTSQIRRWP